ncbi:MAG: exonuclease SbcCD subunit D [Thermoplasmataceae archaeon]
MVDLPRFMHFSDTHLGNREYMMDLREEDFYEAFNEAVDIALEERVDFIIHSGDLFDTWGPSNRALSELKDSMLRLKEKGIRTYMVMGDHDRPRRTDYPAASIFDFLGLTLMGADDLDTLYIEDSDTFIAGISNMKGSRRDSLPQMYARADLLAKENRNSILISHQGVSGYTHPEDVQIQEIDLPGSFAYLAFGHVHVSSYRARPTPFSYAGSTEINSASEIEPFLRDGKSVNIVDVDNGEVSFSRRRLKRTRVQVKVVTTRENFTEDVERVLQKYENMVPGKKPLVISEVHGSSDFSYFRERIATYSDRAIFRRPLLVKESTPSVKVGEHFERQSLFMEYFRGDRRMTDLALAAYNTATSESQESAKDRILALILEGENKGADKEP